MHAGLALRYEGHADQFVLRVCALWCTMYSRSLRLFS